MAANTNNKKNLPLELRSYVKSNDMISAKYKSTLLENQVMAIALTRIEENSDDKDNPLEARLYPGELKRLVSSNTHIYRDLKALAKTITGHTMFLEDGKGNFKSFSIVPNANYIDGVFIIKFNKELKDHLLGLEKNFTPLELSMMTNFVRNSSFRIYELLKKDLWRSKPNVNEGRVDVEYNLFEFRFLIGIANSDNVHVQNKIKSVKVIDWEEVYHILENKGSKDDIKFKTTDRLKSQCLLPAQEELERKSDIRFDFELVRIGKSYKKIVFHIYPNFPNIAKNEKELNEIKRRQFEIENIGNKYRQGELPRDLNEDTQKLYDDFIGHKELEKEDLDLLLKIANYIPLDVRSAIEYVDTKDVVPSYVGYIRDTIKNRWFEKSTICVIDGSVEKGEVISQMVETPTDEETKKRMWNYSKQKEDFEDFLLYEQNVKGISFLELDEIFPPGNAYKEYIDWVLAKRPQG